MKLQIIFLISLLSISQFSASQNVGIGTSSPEAMLHIKGSADTSQLVIDAGPTQSNMRPLIRLRDGAGADLMHIHTDAQFNVFMGFTAGNRNTVSIANQAGLYNTFIGSNAGYFNSTGSFNTAIGRSSLYQNTSGIKNTGVGYKSLFSTTTGVANAGFGSEALLSNIGGSHNVAMGTDALLSNSSGYNNTAIGYRSLYSNTTSDGNTSVGFQALYQQVSGGTPSLPAMNTAIGYAALYSNKPTNTINGIENTAVGGNALVFNTTGSDNTVVGTNAGYGNSTGNVNSFFGAYAGNNSNSSANTAIGYRAMYNTTTGFQNVSLGWNALETNVTGSNNTAVGMGAGVANPGTSDNTIVGAFASVTGSDNVAIGFGAYINGSNVAQLGNTTTAFCGGYTNWTNYASDARIKSNVNEDVKGLEFIMRLRPVTYNLNVRSIYKLWDKSPYGKDEKNISVTAKAEMDNKIRNKESIRTSGFIAQEVEKAAKETGYNFDGIKKPENDKDHYGLTYASFVVPLVKAVQEQQAIIESLKTERARQLQELEQLKARLEKLEKLLVK